MTEADGKLTEVRPRFGSAKGLVEMCDDFDAPLEDFEIETA
ncbi:MAG: DUF2281 domain-containing protein [Rubrobacter sp.]|jgi:hypothetical protein|nr:DUF2281 domain-containing protein [Rubrobacter sp.]